MPRVMVGRQGKKLRWRWGDANESNARSGRTKKHDSDPPSHHHRPLPYPHNHHKQRNLSQVGTTGQSSRLHHSRHPAQPQNHDDSHYHPHHRHHHHRHPNPTPSIQDRQHIGASNFTPTPRHALGFLALWSWDVHSWSFFFSTQTDRWQVTQTVITNHCERLKILLL